uniref:RING-type E3 ubiquitin transferase n=1 Tax=Chenopodium quinoa TaxID=63459 RepID=A0A803MNE4_CHEQI
MASESEFSSTEMQSFLERLITSRNRDISMFLPFMLGFSGPDPTETRPSSEENPTTPEERRERIVLINPMTQGMVVIEGAGLDSLFRGVQSKEGQPPASKSAIQKMPSVEIREGEEKECVICLEECKVGDLVKEMPCKHRFHGGCIDKWLNLHGSCPVCRFNLPIEEEDGGKKGEEEERERRGQREIRVFGFDRSVYLESGD